MDNKCPQAAEYIPGKMHKATQYGRNRDGRQVRVSLFPVVQVSLATVSLCEAEMSGGQIISLLVSFSLCSGVPPTGQPNK